MKRDRHRHTFALQGSGIRKRKTLDFQHELNTNRQQLFSISVTSSTVGSQQALLPSTAQQLQDFITPNAKQHAACKCWLCLWSEQLAGYKILQIQIITQNTGQLINKISCGGDNTCTSWLVILVLSPNKYRSSVSQCSEK